MRFATLLLTTTALLAAGSAFAGDINPVVNTSTDLANDLRGLTFAADGKIYVSGHVGVAPEETETVVGRFNADGTPDTSFGTEGFVTVDVAPGRQEQSLAIAELANGDVVVSVNAIDEDTGTSVYLLRFDNKGVQQIGTGWGDAEGKLEVVLGWANADNAAYPDAEKKPADSVWSLGVDNSSGTEKLVVAAFGPAPQGTDRTDNDRYVLRLLASDGSADPAFNGGKAFVYNSAAKFSDGGRNASIEADGTILSAGYTNFGEGYGNHVILIRLLPDGTPDPAFGGFVEPAKTTADLGVAASPGVAIFNPYMGDGGVSEGYGAARLSDGSYVTTGYGAATGEGKESSFGYASTLAPDLVSFKLTDGKFNAGYGTDGRLAIQSEGKGQPTAEDRGRDVVALPDDRTVHIGRFGGNAAAFVVTADGQLDTDQGDHGVIKLGHPAIDAQLFSAAINADGTRVAATTNASKAGARLIVLEVK